MRNYVDLENGVVERKIFSDPDIYKLEMERIFARAWNFMCHESQIPRPGDFFASWIGEDRVLATRDKAGRVQVLLNTCRHRGNPVCRAELGNAKVFMCPYHGWTYGLDGELVGVPGLKDFYRGDLAKEKWGLPKAAQVDSYKGFVFATMDPEAPPLAEYLGYVGRIGLDLVAARGEVEVVDGIQKNRIPCNWKLAVDNLFDWYHPQVSHLSAERTGFLPTVTLSPMNQTVLLGEYGHAIGGPTALPGGMFTSPWRDRPEAQEALGPVGAKTAGHPNIFPNLWVSTNGTQLSLRLPRGPFETEIWWFTILEKSLSPAERQFTLTMATHLFGPAGLLEQDDGDNWGQSTFATIGTTSRRYPLNFSMGKGHGELHEHESGQRWIDTTVNEHAQLWTYRAWAEWMDAEDWPALKRNHSPVPEGKI